MTIGIIGSRRRDSEADLAATVKAFDTIYLPTHPVCGPGDTLVSGGCPKGGDRFAEIIAVRHRVPIRIHYPYTADLDPRLPRHVAYAKICYARNEPTTRDADVLIAVVAPDRKGGTEHTIKCFLHKWSMTESEALRAGKLVLV
jgi:hypothetical protein